MALQRLARLVLLCAVLAAASVVSADQLNLGTPQTLQSLLGDGASLHAGDKLFTDFSYTPSGNAPTADVILVQGVQIDGNYGLHFFMSPVAGWSASGSQVADGALDFKVTADAGNQIDGVTLSMPGASATGTGAVSIVENVFNQIPGQALAGPLMVVSTANYSVLSATAAMDPAQSFLFCFKNVIVQGGGNGTASVSDFYQVFHQIPEPASLSLLVLGGLAIIRRRRTS